MKFAFQLIALGCTIQTLAAAQHTQLLTFDVGGGGTNGSTIVTGMSSDGRFVVLNSNASDMVPGDRNGASDTFLLDRASGMTSLVSITPNGSSGNDFSGTGDVSNDGRFVAFASKSNDLTASVIVVNGWDQIYLRDMQGASSTLVSHTSAGTVGDSLSIFPSISGDGRFVVYQSFASDLVLNDTNGSWDVFLYDTTLGTTVALSRGPGGAIGTGSSYSPSISRDGRYVAFYSAAADLVVGDLNQSTDVFRFDRVQGTLDRISLTSSGGEAAFGGFIGQASLRCISDDGRSIVFQSTSLDMVAGKTTSFIDVFVRDTLLGTTQRVSVGPGGVEGTAHSDKGWISGDGRAVAFSSQSTTFDARDTTAVRDVYVRRMDAGSTVLVSVNLTGVAGEQESMPGPLTQDGSRIVFSSLAGDLVAGDSNGAGDVFTRLTACCGGTADYCVAKVNSLGCAPKISASGVASASASQGFVVNANLVRNQKVGLLLYTSVGPATAPFGGGTLCLGAPLRRSPGVHSGGTPFPASDCSGVFSLDVNAFRSGALGGNPASFLSVIGQVVDCQYWGRDPGFAVPNNVQLTDALEFLICP